MSYVHAINVIEVPEGFEEEAINVRNVYVDYFRKQNGFVSSQFYRATSNRDAINFVNIVVWESQDAYDAVVNKGYGNPDGLNADGMKVLGKGFPEPIIVHPGTYELIGN